MSVPRSIKDRIANQLQVDVSNVKFLVKSRTDGYATSLTKRGVSSGDIYTDLPTAYAALTANANEALAVLPGSHTITSAFEWGKDYTHIVGQVAPIQINQRARITNSTATVTPAVTFSGDGCIIKNLMVDQQGSHATTAAVCGYVSGDRNYFENVTFRHIGALGMVDNSCRALVMYSTNGENYFKKCTIGADTVDGVTATNYVMEFNGAIEQARNVWDDCIFFGNGSANSAFILATTTSSLSSFQFFKRCKFINNDHGAMDAMTQGFTLTANSGGNFIFEDCLVYGAATLETTNSTVIQVRNAYAAATSDSMVAATF